MWSIENKDSVKLQESVFLRSIFCEIVPRQKIEILTVGRSLAADNVGFYRPRALDCVLHCWRMDRIIRLHWFS